MHTITALMLLATLAGAPTGSGTQASATVTSSATRAPRSVFQELDARLARGALDRDLYHRYRVTAIRQPALLPADLRALLGSAPAPGTRRPLSATRILVEAFQHVVATNTFSGPLHALLQPPDDLTYSIESTNWPIRVSYATASQAAYAQAILDAAELSYDVQIDDFGFAQPVLEPGYAPFRFYVEDAGQGVAGYTAPYDVAPATDRVACYTYIVIDPNLGMNGVGSTVAHEINHSMQASMDCLETTTFWENTAVYVEGKTKTEWFPETFWFIPYFQEVPWRPLDYFEDGGGYQYGGVLWLYYLAERLAPEDGPVFVRELWEASMQAGQINEPDYFDAIETVAAARGADVTDMETLYADFAEARYFVGDNDDGAHLASAAQYTGAEPAVSARHALGDLPLVDEQPPTDERPSAFGTSYVTLDVAGGTTRPLIVRLDGDQSTRWAARVVLTGNGRATETHEIEIDPESGAGQVVVDPSGFATLLLVVVNLGTVGYDPDQQAWGVSDYYYGIQPVQDPPVATAVYPGAVRRGQQNLRLRLVGEGFVYGEGFAIRFSDPLLAVLSIDALTATEVMFTVTVPAGITTGLQDVTVVNPDGQQTTTLGVFAVVDEFDSLDPGPKPKGCQTASGDAPTLPFALGLILVLLGLRRRFPR